MAGRSAAPATSMLEARQVSIAFGGTPVLTDVCLAVNEGEVLALLGPSGSGKSTLLRIVAGLVRHDSGHVVLDGDVIDDVPTYRRNIGLVFQDEQLFPHRTVTENIEFGLRMRKVDRSVRERRVEELLDLVGLQGFGARRVTELSGGEAKRVALARTLAPAPRIVLLDEPLTGLDRDLHEQLADEVGRLLRAAGATAVLVTHDPGEADRVADRVVRMEDL